MIDLIENSNETITFTMADDKISAKTVTGDVSYPD